MLANPSLSAVFGHNPANISANAARPAQILRLLVVVNDSQSSPCALGAHLAHAALRQNQRVLLADLTRNGNLGIAFPSRATSSESLTASHLFTTNIKGLDAEYLKPGLSIVRSDACLVDAKINRDVAAQRLQETFHGMSANFDVCVVEICDKDAHVLAAVLASATAVISTSINGAKPGTAAKRTKRLFTAVTVAAVLNPSLAGLTVIALNQPLSADLSNPLDLVIAERLWVALDGNPCLGAEQLAA